MSSSRRRGNFEILTLLAHPLALLLGKSYTKFIVKGFMGVKCRDIFLHAFI